MNKFDLHDMPVAYFSDNKNADKLRTQLIKNQVLIPEEEQGNLEIIFFSEENMELINKQLILAVFKYSNKQFLIPKQSHDSLIIIMRYVFIEYARHLPYDIMNQIKELNCKVINEIFPNIITNITQKIDYLQELDCPRKLLDLPKNVNKTKNLKSVASILFSE
jgi:hypothetical protein|uniref:Minor capsid protein P8 central region domain-containing protein n=1 Tax=viral metagenome TaxID=1070528 RepID=A0A6C0EE42_9ZZZZ